MLSFPFLTMRCKVVQQFSPAYVILPAGGLASLSADGLTSVPADQSAVALSYTFHLEVDTFLIYGF